MDLDYTGIGSNSRSEYIYETTKHIYIFFYRTINRRATKSSEQQQQHRLKNQVTTGR